MLPAAEIQNLLEELSKKEQHISQIARELHRYRVLLKLSHTFEIMGEMLQEFGWHLDREMRPNQESRSQHALILRKLIQTLHRILYDSKRMENWSKFEEIASLVEEAKGLLQRIEDQVLATLTDPVPDDAAVTQRIDSASILYKEQLLQAAALYRKARQLLNTEG